MEKRIYSCARAHFVRQNESLEDTWRWITARFGESSERLPKSFIPGGWPVEPHITSDSGATQIGDIFTYRLSRGTERHLEITQWDPYHTLAYIEELSPDWSSENYRTTEYPPVVMKFTLHEHPDGTKVTIERVEVGVFEYGIRERIFGLPSKFDENTCVGRLGFILKDGIFPKGERYEDDTYTIVRDDSLKNLRAW